MYEGMDWLLKRHYKTLKQVTLAEECGMGIYINTDKDHEFFSERYVLDIVDYDYLYFDTEEEALKSINEIVPKLSGIKNIKFDSITEFDSWLEERDGYIGPNEEYPTSFNEYYCPF